MLLLPRSADFAVYAAGRDWPVYRFAAADIVPLAVPRCSEVQIQSALGPILAARPASAGIAPEESGGAWRVPARNLTLESGGRSLLIFHTDPAEAAPVSGGRVIHFAAGRTYEEGLVELQTGDTLWIEPGAVVRGVVRAHNAQGIRIGGGGILDGSLGRPGLDPRPVILDACRDVVMEDITIVNPRSWMVAFGACEDVAVRNLHELGECVGSDGIDVVGSRRVRIRDCHFRNNDDCIAIKSRDMRRNPCFVNTPAGDVCDVVVENCIFANDKAGNGLEIGHELSTTEVHDITFRNCDILHVHGHGAPLSIHCGDRAVVHDILWDDLRVEHHYDKFVDFRVMRSQFNRDEERGRIEDITVKNVTAAFHACNPGYTTSQIAGWDEEHMVKGVRFENLQYMGRHALEPIDLDLLTRHAEDITFC